MKRENDVEKSKIEEMLRTRSIEDIEAMILENTRDEKCDHDSMLANAIIGSCLMTVYYEMAGEEKANTYLDYIGYGI